MKFGRTRLVRALSVLVPLEFSGALVGVWVSDGDRLDLLTRTLGYASFVFWAAAAAAASVALYRSRLEPEGTPRRHRSSAATEPERGWRSLTLAKSAAALATLALAFLLAAVGAAVLPDGNGKAAVRRHRSPPRIALAIAWTVEEPLRVLAPGAPSSTQRSATVAFQVADPRRPACLGGEYQWTFQEQGSASEPRQIDVRNACDVVAALKPGQAADVRVREGGASGEATITVRRLLIVSFGDSVAAGEGNPSRRSPQWVGERVCHRSKIAGPRQAAEQVAAAERRAIVIFLQLACTGAWIDGAGAPPKWAKGRPSLLPQTLGAQPSELAQFREERPEGDGDPIVLLSVGANDLGFGPILTKCALPSLPGNCFNKKLGGTRIRALVDERFAALEASFNRLASQAPFSSGDVYLSEYFDPLHDQHGNFCGRFQTLGLSRAEARLAEQLILVRLNALLHREADDRHWQFVDGIASAFRPHGYCAKDSWIVRLHDAIVRLNLKGIFHPNAEGQREYGERIFVKLKPQLGAG